MPPGLTGSEAVLRDVVRACSQLLAELTCVRISTARALEAACNGVHARVVLALAEGAGGGALDAEWSHAALGVIQGALRAVQGDRSGCDSKEVAGSLPGKRGKILAALGGTRSRSKLKSQSKSKSKAASTAKSRSRALATWVEPLEDLLRDDAVDRLLRKGTSLGSVGEEIRDWRDANSSLDSGGTAADDSFSSSNGNSSHTGGNMHLQLPIEADGGNGVSVASLVSVETRTEPSFAGASSGNSRGERRTQPPPLPSPVPRVVGEAVAEACAFGSWLALHWIDFFHAILGLLLMLFEYLRLHVGLNVKRGAVKVRQVGWRNLASREEGANSQYGHPVRWTADARAWRFK